LAATQANTRRTWLAGKLSPEGTAKQILLKLSQFVLSRKLYVTRPYGCLSTSFSRLERYIRSRGAFFMSWDSNAFALKTYRILLAKTGNAMIKPVLF
jgi:hypothetical protein